MLWCYTLVPINSLRHRLSPSHQKQASLACGFDSIGRGGKTAKLEEYYHTKLRFNVESLKDIVYSLIRFKLREYDMEFTYTV